MDEQPVAGVVGMVAFNSLLLGGCSNHRSGVKSSNATESSDNSFLKIGHGFELVVGSLPNTSTITAEFLMLWFNVGQQPEQFW